MARDTVRCPSCGTEARPGARFCGSCGVSLSAERACEACGAPNPAENRFCDACGHALTEARGPGPPQPEPLSYTPDHLAEKILAGRSALEGERKQVTVLFADVMGSMDLAERTDPETWRQLMDRFFALLCEGVHRFDGTVVQFTGDGIMALFGAPIAREDHAVRAGYAALQLAKDLAGYAGDLRRERGLNFSVRMGLNSGEVVVGSIGDDLRVDYTAIGHTVGLAQRMESLAEPGKAYLTDHTAKLLLGYFDLRDLGEFDVKGVSEPLKVFELAGLGRARTRLDLARARGFSRFVGRDEEMAVLDAALTHTLEGNGQVVGVVGEPGVGKSRLCHEFVERCRAQGLAVYAAYGAAHTRTVPFHAALEMLRGYFGVVEEDDDQTARERIAGRLLLLDPAFSDDLPLVFDFLGVPDPERPTQRMDPDARQRRLLAVVKRLVHAHSRREPAVNLLEDLHWVDAASEVLLEALVEAIPGNRSLTIVNFRPEYHAEWMQKSYYRQVPLVPLGPRAIDELLGDLLGGDPSLDGLPEEIRQRTGGNPFFIEEVVQALVEDGTLEGERGAYRLAKPFESIRVPASVHAVLAARIDRLGERDKSLLQAAAVLGKEFGEAVLERVAELSEPDLAAALRALVAAEFLYERALYPEPEYAFKHPLTQEVAYGSQLSERRARVHAAVASATVELYPDWHDERAALIAHHWEAAGEPLEAARWSARAAAWSGINDPAQALRHWGKVRQLAARAEDSEETLALGLAARTWMLQLGWRQGMSEEQTRELYEEGRSLAEQGGDDRSLSLLTSSYAGQTGLGGNMVRGAELGAEAVRLAERSGDVGAVVTALTFHGYAQLTTGRVDEALAAIERGIALGEEDPKVGAGIALGSPYAWFTMMRGFVLGNRGQLNTFARDLERAGELAREHGDTETLGWVLMNWAWHTRLSGELAGVLERVAQSVEMAERLGSTFSRIWAHQNLGLAHVVHEQWDAAIEPLERALRLIEETGTGQETETLALANLALAYQGSGDARARATAERAVSVTRERGLRLNLPATLLSLARVLIRGDGGESLAEAEAALEEALGVAHEMGLRAEEALIRREMAELAGLRGDRAAEEEKLREAQRLFVESGATAHAEAVAARLEAVAAA